MPASTHWPAPFVADSTHLTVAKQPVDHAPIHAQPMEPPQPGGPDVEESREAENTGRSRPEAAATKPSVWLLWRVPVIIGALLVVVGAISWAVPMWFATASGTANPVVVSQMWTYQIADLAAPVLGVGLGMLATLLFIYTQQHLRRREGLRRLYALAAAAVLAAGIYARMATYIFPPVRYETVDASTGTSDYYYSSADFTNVLSMEAAGPLLVGLLMFAALAISRKFSLLRMHLVGVLLLGLAVFSQCARFLFPDVPSTTQYYEGGNQGIPGWPFMLPLLTSALLTAGALVVAGAVLFPALKAVGLPLTTGTKFGQSAKADDTTPDTDEHPDEELVEREPDNGQTKL